jgi:hypothetical protein
VATRTLRARAHQYQNHDRHDSQPAPEVNQEEDVNRVPHEQSDAFDSIRPRVAGAEENVRALVSARYRTHRTKTHNRSSGDPKKTRAFWRILLQSPTGIAIAIS